MQGGSYFIPRFAGSCCKFVMKLCYASVFISAVLMFIVGISRADSNFVGISVGLMACIVCFGYGFSRCYDYCYKRMSKSYGLIPQKKYETKYLVPVYHTDFQEDQV